MEAAKGRGQGPPKSWLLGADKHSLSASWLLSASPQVPGMGGGRWREAEGLLTCTTRTRLSGYLVKTVEKASTGSRSTVESRAARADTVRWGCWWPCGRGEDEENQDQGLCTASLLPKSFPMPAPCETTGSIRGDSRRLGPPRRPSLNQPTD